MRGEQFLRIMAVAPLALLVGVGCGGEDTQGQQVTDQPACEAGTFPDAPDGVASVLHVSAVCPAEGADGSAAHPYPTISAALAEAAAGAAILIAPGTYAENLQIAQDIMLIGSSDPMSPEAAVAIIQAPAEHAISVTAGEGVILRGLRVAQPSGSGLLVRGGAVTLEGSSIEGAAPSADGSMGSGVIAVDDGSIILQNSAVTGAAGIGVHVSGARAIILQSTIRGCAGPGIRIDQAMEEVRIEGSTIEANTQMGVGVFSSRAIILQNIIKDTQTDAADIGDGVLAASLVDGSGNLLEPADIELDGNEISGSGRVGVLCAAGTRGIILQNNTIGQNGNLAPFGAGVWLQGGAGGVQGNLIQGNTLTGNKFVGIGMTGETHGIILQNNAVSGTSLGTTFSGPDEIDVGDGIGLFSSASAQILGNTVSGNGRFGLILDQADGAVTSVEGNTFEGNDQYGIILQNQPNAPATSNNSFQGNLVGDVSAVPEGTYGVRVDAFSTN